MGLLGGTFDPVHIGHLAAASEVRAVLGLDEIRLVVAGVPWQKVDDRQITPAADRLAFVEAAVRGVEGIVASDIEVVRDGPTYTADTLAEIHASEPEAELFLVLGADAAALLPTWERPEEVRRLCTLVVIDRPGAVSIAPDRLRDEGWRVETVVVPHLAISSTDLRARMAAGRPIDFLVPEAAVREIKARGRYARR